MLAKNALLKHLQEYFNLTTFLNEIQIREGLKKKKNLEFSRFSGWVGLKKSIFQI